MAPAKLGYAKFVSTFDDDDNVTRQEYQGVDQQPVFVPQLGFSRVSFSYSKGNLVEQAYSGPDGKLVQPRVDLGVAKTTWKYDANGNRIEENYLGADERPTLSRAGYAAIKRDKDDRGILHARGLDLSGNLAWTIVTINQVLPGGQGERVGLRPGDRILEYFGQPVHNAMELTELTLFSRNTEPGILKIAMDNGETTTLQVYPGPLQVSIQDDGPAVARTSFPDLGSGGQGAAPAGSFNPYDLQNYPNEKVEPSQSVPSR